MEATHLLIDMDTYGGLVSSADAMRTALLETELVTAVYIRNNAASAGALISIACDSIYMSPGSTIGAASVVYGDGSLAPEKMQSYMKGKMEATAKANGRDPRFAAAMVGADSTIPGVIDSGKVITFDVDEALKYGYCNKEATSVEQAIEFLNLENVEVIEHKISSLEKIIHLLLRPAVSSILLLIIIGGIYFELQTPGVGFPILASIIAAILYFAPAYYEELAETWEILLFVAGIVLLAIEIFAIPGFGVAGISGSLLIFSGLVLALVRNVRFDFSYVPSEEIYFAILLVLGSVSFGLIAMFFLMDKMTKIPFLKVATLSKEETVEDGYTVEDKAQEALIGKTGIATTTLRPSGRIKVDGIYYDAQADAEWLEEGTAIRVIAVQSTYIIVTEHKE